jgi:hypothetical protein
VIFVVQGLKDCGLSVLVHSHHEFQILLFFSPLGVSSTYLGRASSFTLGFFSLTFPAGAAAVCFACFSANLRALSALARSFATRLCQMAGSSYSLDFDCVRSFSVFCFLGASASPPS